MENVPVPATFTLESPVNPLLVQSSGYFLVYELVVMTVLDEPPFSPVPRGRKSTRSRRNWPDAGKKNPDSLASRRRLDASKSAVPSLTADIICSMCVPPPLENKGGGSSDLTKPVNPNWIKSNLPYLNPNTWSPEHFNNCTPWSSART